VIFFMTYGEGNSRGKRKKKKKGRSKAVAEEKGEKGGLVELQSIVGEETRGEGKTCITEEWGPGDSSRQGC